LQQINGQGKEKNWLLFKKMLKWAYDGLVSIIIASVIFAIVAFFVPGSILKLFSSYHPSLKNAFEEERDQRLVLAKTIFYCVVDKKKLPTVGLEQFGQQELIERASDFDRLNGEISHFNNIYEMLSRGLTMLEAGDGFLSRYVENLQQIDTGIVLSYLEDTKIMIDMVNKQPDSPLVREIPTLPKLRSAIKKDYESIDRYYTKAFQIIESGNAQEINKSIDDIKEKVISTIDKYQNEVQKRKEKLYGVINHLLNVY